MPSNEPIHVTTNLFGWYDDKQKGLEETRRLLILLIAGNGFSYVSQGKGCVILEGPFKYQAILGVCGPWLSLSDNGGEMNAEWINRPDTMRSIPSTKPYSQGHVTAETMHYRLLCALDGDETNYWKEEEPIDLAIWPEVSARISVPGNQTTKLSTK